MSQPTPAAPVPTSSNPDAITSSLTETRVFPPRPAKELGFDRWHIGSLDEYRALHRRSVQDTEPFWAEEAQRLSWFRRWDRVLEWNAPDAKWFVGGHLNACYNCVDRHVQAGHGDEVAIVWEGDDPNDTAKVTYAQLHEQVCRLANAMKARGVKKGAAYDLHFEPSAP